MTLSLSNQFMEKKEIYPGYRAIMHQHSIPNFNVI